MIGQIYLTDMFLGYQFTKFGRDVFAQSEMDLNTREDPMHRVFPKVAKCSFSKYGPSGSIQNHDALCVLPINIINEKIYIFLYFWFVFLGAISAMWLLYRFLTIVSLSLRVSIIYYRSDKQVPKPLIEAAISNPKHTTLERLGDYLLLYFITKNVNPLIIKVISFRNMYCTKLDISDFKKFVSRMFMRRLFPRGISVKRLTWWVTRRSWLRCTGPQPPRCRSRTN